jgi:hypothetical protein
MRKPLALFLKILEPRIERVNQRRADSTRDREG